MPATAENRICIAVVPIEDFPSQSEDYFAAGLTEDPVSAAFPIDSSRLRVVTIPKSEAGDRVEQIDRLRKQLSLDYLLRGSVRRSTGEIRITSQWHDPHDKSIRSSEACGRKPDVLLAARIIRVRHFSLSRAS